MNILQKIQAERRRRKWLAAKLNELENKFLVERATRCENSIKLP